MMNYYKIAGLTVAMEVSGRIEQQAADYQCAPCDNPNMILTAGFPRFFESRKEQMSDSSARYIYTAARFYVGLLEYNGLMMHSSAVVVDGKAYLFSAVSGTGKSTHTQLWLDQFGDRAYILNDDKPALRLIDGVWHACGTPWNGKNDLGRPDCVPLQGIAILRRCESNRIERLGSKAATFELLEQTLKPSNKRAELLELLDLLVTQVPVWQLHCNMEPEAALVSYNAMSGT